MTRTVRTVTLLCAIGLGGCYVPDQKPFEGRVSRAVWVGMPLQQGISRLSQLHLACSGTQPIDCSRIRRSLMPYSCLERVRLHWSGEVQRVTAVEIPRILCTGL